MTSTTEIVWPARLSKSSTILSQFEGQILLDIMDDHGLGQMIHFPTRDKKPWTILTSLPSQFQEIYSPDKFSDYDIVSGFFENLYSTYKEKLEEIVFISEM